MPKVRYQVKLSEEERAMLSHLANTARGTPQKVKNALILLAVDCGEFQENRNTDERIAEILDIDRSRIYRVKRDCVEHSIETALTGRTADRFHRSRKLDGEQEAKLVAISCSTPPAGHSQWSLRMLADKLVELKIVDSISHETVGRTLKKTKSSHGSGRNG
jgi:hypothetical protein